MIVEVMRSLTSVGECNIQGVGTVRRGWNREVTGHNPRTGETMTSPAGPAWSITMDVG